MSTTGGERLRGRRSECDSLDGLLAGVRAGHSAVLVLRGEAGVGKTALLRHLAGRAADCRIARAAGGEGEMELPFSGLHQLCAPLLGSLERLPEPQRDALATAFGLSAGEPPDRFLVGLAVLGLLSDAAEAEPLLCLVDDAQWLDRVSAQTLAFVARRLHAERVALVFALRDAGDELELAGIPELAIRGLSADDAGALLDSVLHGPLDERVHERIVAETRGNPLALLELPRGLTPAELAGGFGLSDSMPLMGRIERGFLGRLEPLPLETRQVLLAAAAEPIGDVTLLWRAVEQLGIGPEAAAAAEATGLISIGARVRFRHPLVRSAAYRSASAGERQEAHRVLADVTDPRLDPHRRAWHRAHATPAPDEEVAAELEHSAGRAQARGGLAAAAAFLEQAALLTPDPERRAQRGLAAARAKRNAGALTAALGLLTAVDSGPADALRTAEVERLRGQIAFDEQRSAEAARRLRHAAARLEPLDALAARETHLEALAAALWASGPDGAEGVLEAAETARAGPAATPPGRAVDAVLDGLVTRLTEG